MDLRQTLIVDASYNHGTGVTGIGIAVHETDKPGRNGILIDQIAEAYANISAGAGELLAVYRALEIGLERGFSTVRIRSDYNAMRKALKRDQDLREGFPRRDLYGEILRMTKNYDSVQFAYKPKRKNRMPHELARRAVQSMTAIHRTELVELTARNPHVIAHTSPALHA